MSGTRRPWLAIVTGTLVVLGLLVTLAFNIRREGLVLLGCLAVADLVRMVSARRMSSWRATLVPYATFAAVVAVITFFPMLVNTLAGLQAAGRIERDLMRSYAAGHRQTLLKLTLPAALPFWAIAAVAGGMLGSTLGTRKLGGVALRRLLGVVLIAAGVKLLLAV